MTATQAITFIPLYSFNNITLKMTAKRSKHVGENLVSKIHHKHWSEFYWLFIQCGKLLNLFLCNW